ncbi:MAG: type II secretion system F family protein [Holosporaceae bacterium]|nr:type II secretion system F family protein [Holosporaceae bacterium]
MDYINDNIFIFVLSFISFFFVYNFTKNKPKNINKNENKLKERINTLSKQQETQLTTSGNVDSTFVTKTKHDFQDNIQINGIIDKIAIIMKKAGITTMPVAQFVTICSIGGSVFAAIIVHFHFLNAITGIPIGMCGGGYLVYFFLAAQASKKKNLFLKQFPDAIDMMIRGVKAGLNISRIIKLVSMEAKDPIASEYRIISQKLDLGIEPEKVLLEAAEKIDLEEFRFLVVALILQMENGGVLADILQNLSGLIRKRLELVLKLKAMSAEARMSAIVISVLPFVFAGIMAIVNPNHLKEFITPGTGQTLLKVAIALFGAGAFFMFKASKIKV